MPAIQVHTRWNKAARGQTLSRLRKCDDGLSTAEYAIGTIAVAGLGGLLIRLLTSDWFFGLLQGIFSRALGTVGG